MSPLAHHVNPGSSAWPPSKDHRTTLRIGKTIPSKCSAKSQGVADRPIGARGRLRHHSGTANEYCPSFIDHDTCYRAIDAGWLDPMPLWPYGSRLETIDDRAIARRRICLSDAA